ncbi:MAG: hypothetical protein M1821_005878 [Bathelium mastoideum]|nr:MAG: hypothetical protein M1821_005878 [Bathelium mastoideum]
MAFVVIKHYDPRIFHKGESKQIISDEDACKGFWKDNLKEIPSEDLRPVMISEQIKLGSTAAEKATSSLELLLPDQLYHWFESNIMYGPYLPFFHHRNLIEGHIADLDPEDQESMKLLVRYVLEQHGSEYEQAEALFTKGLVTEAHLRKLYRPNDILVYVSDDQSLGYLCADWPDIRTPDMEDLEDWSVSDSISFSTLPFTLQLVCWRFDGLFRKVTTSLSVSWPYSSSRILKITDLKIYPLRYAEAGMKEKLQDRGLKFWKCRHRIYAGYDGPSNRSVTQNVTSRFMIDYGTYRELHKESAVFATESRDDLPAGAMDKDEPPDGPFIFLLPAIIDGFAMQDKKWRTLLVEHITPVQWNKTAFDRLVLKAETKEVVEALVTVHISSKQSADVIEGKGNGLIILLHGGPGTGKTLTAESVAELAEKPLYRVTCGDIGTDAEGVEQYLESVLYIGRIWGCVVLLDEADVFLEERSLTDLHRNALVSVFLRVLEYYEGILILTSNRVGIFDEAFKSRIKLALHYQPLSKADRKKIWRNFIKSLRDNDAGNVDYEDLDDHLDDLAEHELNGRQIRNAVSTASELAQFRKKKLDFGHFAHIIQIAGEFDTYLEKTHGHTDREWTRSQGTRY